MSAEILFFTGVSRKSPVGGPPEGGDLRWRAEITYRTAAGPMVLDFQVEEIEDVADAISEGPDWRCIESICLSLFRSADAFAGLVLPLQDNQEDGA